MTDKQPKGTKIKTYRREIPVVLSEKEVHDYGQKLASKKRERDVLVEKAKQVAKTYKGDESTIASEIDRLANAINSGRELRSTEVEDYLDGSQVFTYVAGSGEPHIDQRPAGFADEQTDMFATPDEVVDETPAKPAKAKRGKKKGAATDAEPGAIGGSDADREHNDGDFQPPTAAEKKAKKPRKKKAKT